MTDKVTNQNTIVSILKNVTDDFISVSMTDETQSNVISNIEELIDLFMLDTENKEKIIRVEVGKVYVDDDGEPLRSDTGSVVTEELWYQFFFEYTPNGYQIIPENITIH